MTISDHEPVSALRRDLTTEEAERKAADAELGERIKREAKRRRSLGAVARGAARSVKINAALSAVQTIVLLMILTRQWPELWPAILKAAAKMIGG